ncbi:MAG: ATP-binding protein [Myxococcota bacterium]
MSGRLELRLKPDWELIQGTWDDCMRLFGANGLNPDVSYALCMAARELLENAVKYGSYDGTRDAIDFSVMVSATDITIEVKNPIDSATSSLKGFDATIQWIRGYQNPFEAYVEKLKELSAQPFSPARSGLGLTRIAYEGQCVLDFYVNESNILAVSAVYHR